MRTFCCLIVFVAVGWLAICIYHVVNYDSLPGVPMFGRQSERESYKRPPYSWQKYQR